MAENEMNKGLSQVSIRLVQESPLLSDESINTPEQAVKVLGEWLEGMDRELVCVLNLQADLKPINMNIVSMGALNEAQVHPREVMKSAILSNAACMMLLHNHPSGSLKPSKEDVKVTDMMHQVGNLLQIPLVDHIIIGKNKQFYSIRDQEDYDIPKPSYISDINQLKWPQTMLKEEQFYQDKSNASENKARKLEEIMDELEQGVQSILTSENYMNYLKFLSSFHSYNIGNTLGYLGWTTSVSVGNTMALTGYAGEHAYELWEGIGQIKSTSGSFLRYTADSSGGMSGGAIYLTIQMKAAGFNHGGYPGESYNYGVKINSSIANEMNYYKNKN